MADNVTGAATRQRLVAAATESLRRSGYHGTTLKHVTAAASATIGSAYHFFPGGKSELIEVALRESGAAYFELFVLIASQADTPADAIAAFIDGAADTLEQSGFIDPCPIGGVAREVANTEERLRVASDEVFVSWIEGAAAGFALAGLTDREAAELAELVVAGIEGGFVLARTRRDAELLRRIGTQLSTAVAAAFTRVS